jgi:ribosomal protein S12 methylthiotransferase accessory factor YcaO
MGKLVTNRPPEDRLKDGERAVRQRQKRIDTDKQQDWVLKEKINNNKKKYIPYSIERTMIFGSIRKATEHL